MGGKFLRNKNFKFIGPIKIPGIEVKVKVENQAVATIGAWKAIAPLPPSVVPRQTFEKLKFTRESFNSLMVINYKLSKI